MKSAKICVIGQVIVDVFQTERQFEVRLGGAMHAARGLWAVGNPFDLLYIAPTYLDDDTSAYARKIGARDVRNIGTVTGCPNVLLIGEPREVGDQQYEMILEKHFRCDFDIECLRRLPSDVSDVIILPGGFDLKLLLSTIANSQVRVHIDCNLEPTDFSTLKALGRKFTTFIVSTSSAPFLNRFRGSAEYLCHELNQVADNVLLKENRGGSRFFPECNFSRAIHTPSHPRLIRHSIGVGDCFDAVFVSLKQQRSNEAALAYASLIAAEYACELELPSLEIASRSTLQIPEKEVVDLKGISLAWEVRKKCNIYIAAPDFSNVDTTQIDVVVDSLAYHNFSPRRPIKENGEISPDADLSTKSRAARADLLLLDECQIVVAVLLFNDPGTLIEIGIAIQQRKPVVVYDPLGITSNLMLITLPNLVSSDIDEVLTKVFELTQNVIL